METSTATSKHFDTDVVVVGAGPCGLITANLLGLYGIRTLVVERDTEAIAFPRAVGIDDESLRTCQTIGLIDDVLADTVQNTPIRYYTSWGRCFAHVKPSAQPFGWPRRNLFLQPMFEATLRRGVQRYAHVETRFGCEVDTVSQDATGTTSTITNAAGETTTVRSKFVVGANGGRSGIRQLLNVTMLGETAPVKWLVIDVCDDDLNAPYSAVYCDPKQPILMVPLPYRHRRWEFKLHPDDDETAATTPEQVDALLRPRYVNTPMPTVLRARVYLHHSRTADTFGTKRIFIAGDAAHLQPPFFGQGMNSGVRDATNLAWKLAAAVRGQAGGELLGTYDAERRPHASEMVQFATRIGQMYSPKNNVTERLRDVMFRGLQMLPGGKEYILQMKYKPMPHYTQGAVLHQEGHGAGSVGRMFMQPDVETTDRKRLKLDDAIGSWFAVVGINVDPRESLSERSIAWWESIGAQFVQIVKARSGAKPAISGRPTNSAAPNSTLTVGTPSPKELLLLEDVDGAFRDWLLAKPKDEIIILRPDHYVGAAADRASFETTTKAFQSTMGSGRS